MAILGFPSHLPLLPKGGGGTEYGYIRNLYHFFLQNGTTIRYDPFIESTQGQANESTLEDYTHIMGKQTIKKVLINAFTNANLGTTILEVRHSEDLVSWATVETLFSISTLSTGIFTVEPDTVMNDDEYYLRKNSSGGTGQLWANIVFKIEVA